MTCDWRDYERPPCEEEHSVLSTEASTISESGRGCSVLTKFSLKNEERATFEWENGKVATVNLTKEKGECIYRLRCLALVS